MPLSSRYNDLWQQDRAYFETMPEYVQENWGRDLDPFQSESLDISGAVNSASGGTQQTAATSPGGSTVQTNQLRSDFDKLSPDQQRMAEDAFNHATGQELEFMMRQDVGDAVAQTGADPATWLAAASFFVSLFGGGSARDPSGSETVGKGYNNKWQGDPQYGDLYEDIDWDRYYGASGTTKPSSRVGAAWSNIWRGAASVVGLKENQINSIAQGFRTVGEYMSWANDAGMSAAKAYKLYNSLRYTFDQHALFKDLGEFEKAYYDAAFPGTNPYERLGQSGVAGTVLAAQIGAAPHHREQDREDKKLKAVLAKLSAEARAAYWNAISAQKRGEVDSKINAVIQSVDKAVQWFADPDVPFDRMSSGISTAIERMSNAENEIKLKEAMKDMDELYDQYKRTMRKSGEQTRASAERYGDYETQISR